MANCLVEKIGIEPISLIFAENILRQNECPTVGHLLRLLVVLDGIEPSSLAYQASSLPLKYRTKFLAPQRGIEPRTK